MSRDLPGIPTHWITGPNLEVELGTIANVRVTLPAVPPIGSTATLYLGQLRGTYYSEDTGLRTESTYATIGELACTVTGNEVSCAIPSALLSGGLTYLWQIDVKTATPSLITRRRGAIAVTSSLTSATYSDDGVTGNLP